MKHRKTGRTLGRARNQRIALLKTLCGSLILQEKITTTEAKAKEMRPLIDHLIAKAKRSHGAKHPRMTLVKKLERHLPLVAIKKLSGSFLKIFDGRSSGYTRIVKLPRRKSDSAKMAMIAFVKTEKNTGSVDAKEKGSKKVSGVSSSVA